MSKELIGHLLVRVTILSGILVMVSGCSFFYLHDPGELPDPSERAESPPEPAPMAFGGNEAPPQPESSRGGTTPLASKGDCLAWQESIDLWSSLAVGLGVGAASGGAGALTLEDEAVRNASGIGGIAVAVIGGVSVVMANRSTRKFSRGNCSTHWNRNW